MWRNRASIVKALLQQARDALQYAADEMTPISGDGCTCPVCTALAAIDAELAKPDQSSPITQDKAEELAHRRCRRYVHIDTEAPYHFDRHTLMDFIADVQKLTPPPETAK
jgi:hypothetical protein